MLQKKQKFLLQFIRFHIKLGMKKEAIKMNNKFSKNKFVANISNKKEIKTKEELIEKVCEFGGNDPEAPEVKEIFGRMSKRELNSMIQEYEKNVKAPKRLETFHEM